MGGAISSSGDVCLDSFGTPFSVVLPGEAGLTRTGAGAVGFCRARGGWLLYGVNQECERSPLTYRSRKVARAIR